MAYASVLLARNQQAAVASSEGICDDPSLPVKRLPKTSRPGYAVVVVLR